MTMKPRTRQTFSVFEQFRRFWHEVEELREAALSPVMAPAGDAPAEGALVHAPTSARDRLLAVLRSQEAELGRWAKGEVLEYAREAQYVMVAAADEVFVRLSWSGARYWGANLLETERFGTRSAGQVVFARMDRLLERGNPELRELAAVYLTALALGFRGKYGDRSDDGAIERYRVRLHEFIFEKRPDLAHHTRKLVPTCYDSTMAVGTGPMLRSPRTWWWAAAAVVAVWLVVAQILWMGLVDPLRVQVDGIADRVRQLDAVR